jgi:aspartate carbamoyltransferase catalytic subunit
VKKGETLIDTAMTLNAMHPDVLVVRHPERRGEAALREGQLLGDQRRRRQPRAPDPGAARRAHDPPPAGKLGRAEVAICGDILHSRVARSNIHLLNT